jgi:hypothetical protein
MCEFRNRIDEIAALHGRNVASLRFEVQDGSLCEQGAV